MTDNMITLIRELDGVNFVEVFTKEIQAAKSLKAKKLISLKRKIHYDKSFWSAKLTKKGLKKQKNLTS